MRVAILQEVPSVRVTVLAPVRVVDWNTQRLIEERQELRWQEIAPGNPGLRLGKNQMESSSLLLVPKEAAVLRVNARSYRGSLIVMKTPKGNLTVINRLPLEEYLVSALASEANPDWPLQVLKAHAVVSRTMVAHRIWIRRQADFDMTADTSTHLYYGVSVERDWARRAVQETGAQVLSYQGELLSATFHANCGGHTEDAAQLWQVAGDPAPLRGVPDPYCKDRRHFRWKGSITWSELRRRLGDRVNQVGDLKNLEILERNRSHRVRSIRIVGTQGSLTLTGREFRELLGANRLRSLNFTVRTSPKAILFQGFGWGHGVGFCQWGAYGMARSGRTMDVILAFYFPRAQRRNLKGLPGFDSGS